MKRSLQEYVELVVFGLIALLVGTGLLWVGGWVLSFGGVILKGLAGLLWMLLRFVVPVAIAAGLVYFLVRAAQGRQRSEAGSGSGSSTATVGGTPSYTPPATDVSGAASASAAAGAPADPINDSISEFDAADSSPTVADTATGMVDGITDPASGLADDVIVDDVVIDDVVIDDVIADDIDNLENDENDRS